MSNITTMQTTGWHGLNKTIADISLLLERDPDIGDLMLNIDAQSQHGKVFLQLHFEPEQVQELREALEEYESMYAPDETGETQ